MASVVSSSNFSNTFPFHMTTCEWYKRSVMDPPAVWAFIIYHYDDNSIENIPHVKLNNFFMKIKEFKSIHKTFGFTEWKYFLTMKYKVKFVPM